MIIANNNIEPDYASEVTIRRLRYLIAVALIDSEEKLKLESLTYTCTEEEAVSKISYLQEYLPIPGFHTTPHGTDEINQAVKFMADKDDFYDRTIRPVGGNAEQSRQELETDIRNAGA